MCTLYCLSHDTHNKHSTTQDPPRGQQAMAGVSFLGRKVYFRGKGPCWWPGVVEDYGSDVDHSKVFANKIKQSKVALSKVFLPQRYSVRMPFAFLAVAGVSDEIIANCRRRHTTVWPYVSVLMESSPLGQGTPTGPGPRVHQSKVV